MAEKDYFEEFIEKIEKRLSIASEQEFDDELALPNSIEIIDIGDGPVAIEQDDEIEDREENFLSFSNIYNTPKKFSAFSREVFIPGQEITVQIIDYERNLTTHFLNPNLYTISLVHGNFSWQIKKRYKQIQYLHQQLLIFRAGLNIPLPTRTHRIKRKSFKRSESENGTKKKKKKSSLPRFPKKPEVLVTHEKLESRQKQLEDYLNNLLEIKVYRNHPATIEFLEVSPLSFVNGLGAKRKEGMIKKRNGSTQPGQAGCNVLGMFRSKFCIRWRHFCSDVLCARWVERWFFVKDTYFGYINPGNGTVRALVLFDQGFEVASGMYSTGLHKGFQILTFSRQIAFKCWTKRKRREWVETLKEVANSTARDFTQPNRHRSFAPVRNQISASWFVDGSSYLSTVADAIENAKEEVFITDWWLSPEIYLKRPAIDGHYWRLDVLLKRKATQGVKIFILLYKEVEFALGLNSYYSKTALSHTNIKVLRHPDHAKVGVIFWAHHEKIVVVDQNYAFLGGIDLCYGRWDDHNHRLTDLGSATPILNLSGVTKKNSNNPSGDLIYPIPTPVFTRPVPDIVETIENNENDLSPTEEKSLPILAPDDLLLMPTEVLEHIKCETPLPHKKSVLKSLKDTVKKSKNLVGLVYAPNEKDLVEEEQTKVETTEADDVVDDLVDRLTGSSKLWIGKDYVNFIVRDFSDLEYPFEDSIDRRTTPRMPWHDIGMCVQGAAAKDLARHFIQRWNATKLEKAKKNETYPYLQPKSYDEFRTLPIKLPNAGEHKVTCQVLRSVSTWSCGFLEPDAVEQSIHEAYLQTIANARHYIYIENQFFISLSYKNPNTRNGIAEEIFKRIVRAHKCKEKFRVYVVMPLLPGFEGEVGGKTGTSLHAITYWNYASISRGEDAIINRLLKEGIEDPSEYISFYGLRNHSKLNNEPITELVYVHSKLLIADDRIVICGSANINDRSMLGKRDSEVAVLIEDEVFEDGIMNGARYSCGKFAGGLRKYLFSEHLGLLDANECKIDVTDPVANEFYRKHWYDTASLNTELYEKVFHCIPTDKVTKFEQLEAYRKDKPLYVDEVSRAEKMLETIQGHLVLLPLKFLFDEYLIPAISTMEGIMPTALWT